MLVESLQPGPELRLEGGGLGLGGSIAVRFRHEYGLRSGIQGGQAPALCMQAKARQRERIPLPWRAFLGRVGYLA